MLTLFVVVSHILSPVKLVFIIFYVLCYFFKHLFSFKFREVLYCHGNFFELSEILKNSLKSFYKLFLTLLHYFFTYASQILANFYQFPQI